MKLSTGKAFKRSKVGYRGGYRKGDLRNGLFWLTFFGVKCESRFHSAFQAALMLDDFGKVASTGIEPVSGASETLILSIVRRGLVNV